MKKGCYVFHAGSKFDSQNRVVTNGGRFVGVTAWEDSLKSARKLAYEASGRPMGCCELVVIFLAR